MKPTFPVINFYKNALDIIPSEENLKTTSLLGLILHDENGIYYDNNGFRWNCKLTSNKYKTNFFNKLLANTFYNPLIDIEAHWIKIDTYSLDELKSEVIICINKNDDIFTQFIDAYSLIKEIDKSEKFEELYFSLDKYVFNTESLEGS